MIKTYCQFNPIAKIPLKVFFILGLHFLLVSATAQRVTLNERNTSLSTIFSKIQRQTGVAFVFADKQLENTSPVTINLKDASLTDVLNQCFKGQPVTYSLNNGVVTIVPIKANLVSNQQLTLYGKVVNEFNDVINGATVSIKSLSKETKSDHKGEFHFTGLSAGSYAVQIAHLGYKTKKQSVILGAQARPYIFQLTDSAQIIQEINIVNTGYQSLEKRMTTGSEVVLSAKDVVKDGVLNIDEALKGWVPGVGITTTSGGQGATAKVRVRGTSTFIGNASPIWVVDGIIREDPIELSPISADPSGILTDAKRMQQLSQNADYSVIGNSIAGVNPRDIESITFLKDASATAIYGVRAANGVIVIKTKKGEAGERTPITYSGSLSLTGKLDYSMFNLMNSKERINVSREIAETGLPYQYTPLSLSYEGLINQLSSHSITADEFNTEVAKLETNNTDWMDLFFRNQMGENHYLNVSGGAEKSTYYVSLGYTNSQGSSKSDAAKRYTATLRTTAKVNDRLTLDFKASGSIRDASGYFSVNPYDYALTTSRTIPSDLYYSTINSTDYSLSKMLTFNFLNELDHTANQSTNREMQLAANVQYRILEGLEFSSQFGFNYSGSDRKQWADEYSFYASQRRGYDFGTVAAGSADELASQLPNGGILFLKQAHNSNYTWRNSLNLNRKLRDDKDRLIVLLGMELRSNKTKGLDDSEWGYFPDRGETISMDYNVIPGSSLLKHNAAIINNVNNVLSAYSTVAYSISDKYVLNASIRGDASNRFGQYSNNKFLPVYSLGAKWNIAEEDFLKNSFVLNVLNLRATYGIQGNVVSTVGPNLIATYPASPISPSTREYYLNLKSLGYPDLRWEKTNSYNLGLDIGLFNSRINITSDFYLKKGNDLIMATSLPYEYGIDVMYSNGAKMKNYGIEAQISAQVIKTNDFTWNLSINGAKNYNETIKAGVASQKKDALLVSDFLNGLVIREGYSINALYAYRFTGLNHDTGLPTFDLSTGDGDPKDPSSFLAYAGKKDPDLMGGLQTSFRYKAFSLSGSFAYSFGNVVRLNPLYNTGPVYAPQPQTNLSGELVDRWRQPGDELRTNIPVLTTPYASAQNVTLPNGSLSYLYTLYNNSTERIVNGSFLRCTNLSAGYTLPNKWMNRAGLQSAGLTLSITNPFLIADSRLNGQDPETVGTGSTALPIISTYNLGLSVTF